jgi:hypothetical protein
MPYSNIQRLKNGEIAAISIQSTVSNVCRQNTAIEEWTIKFLDYSQF